MVAASFACALSFVLAADNHPQAWTLKNRIHSRETTRPPTVTHRTSPHPHHQNATTHHPLPTLYPTPTTPPPTPAHHPTPPRPPPTPHPHPTPHHPPPEQTTIQEKPEQAPDINPWVKVKIPAPVQKQHPAVQNQIVVKQEPVKAEPKTTETDITGLVISRRQ